MSNLNLTQLVLRILQRLNRAERLDPNETLLLTEDLTQFQQVLQANPPTLANTTSDFNSLLLQLQDRIKRNDTWKSFSISSTGRTLLELVASVGAFNQTGLQVAFREAFSDTAVRPTSHYTLARTLGARIGRKVPTKTKVWLKRSSRADTQSIPPFTSFIVNGLEFFNPNEIIFPAGESMLPLNVEIDADGKATKKDDFISSLYLADISFAEEGQFYYPCKGIVQVAVDDTIYEGEVRITTDVNHPDTAFGSLFFAETFLAPASAEFKIRLSQYNGAVIEGVFKARTGSALLRFPGSIPFQIKRTGVGSSVLTPAVGTGNIPDTIAVITDEDIDNAKAKYLLPEYLDQSVLLYDTDIFLHSGRVQSTTHIVKARNANFYSIAIGVPGFQVADDYITVEVFDGTGVTKWKRAEKAIWEYGPEDRVFVDTTLGNGDALITFGDGLHGKAVEELWQVGIRYVLTKGSAGNGAPSDSTVMCPSFGLEGGTLSTTYGGADEKPAAYYKAVAPSIYKSKNRMITAGEHEDFILNLPGVADVAVLRQKDLAAHDIRLMNRITIVMLPFSPDILVYPPESLLAGKAFDPTIVNPKDPFEPNRIKFSDLELKDLELAMKKTAYAAADLDVYRAAIPKPIVVKIRAFCYRQYAVDTVKAKIAVAIKQLFTRKRGILGRSLLLVDLSNACKMEEVDYVEILQPTFDTILGTGSSETYTFICLEDSPEITVEYTSRRA